MDARSLGLEVRWRWGDQLLWAERVPLDRLTAQTRLGPPGLPTLRAERVDGSVSVRAPSGAELELLENAPTHLHFASLDAELSLRPAPPRAAARWDEAFESSWWNTLLLCAVTLVFAVIAAPQSDGDDDSAEALTRSAPRIVKMIPVTPPPVHHTAAVATQEPVQHHSAPTPARAPTHKPGKSGPDLKQLFNGSGLSALFAPGGVGSALAQATQGMNRVAGNGGPFGGMGLRGGNGGGDPGGTTFGIGSAPLHGRDYGVGAGKLCDGDDCKAHPGLQLEHTGVTVVGSLDRELIRQVIHNNHSAIRFCYDQALVRNPSLTGRVDMHFVISGDGSVMQANVAASTAQDSELDACLRERFARMLFPKPLGGGIVDVRYPVVLTQGGR